MKYPLEGNLLLADLFPKLSLVEFVEGGSVFAEREDVLVVFGPRQRLPGKLAHALGEARVIYVSVLAQRRVVVVVGAATIVGAAHVDVDVAVADVHPVHLEAGALLLLLLLLLHRSDRNLALSRRPLLYDSQVAAPPAPRARAPVAKRW